MKFFMVVAKCGHVGRGHYIIKNFYVKANDGKEAAFKVRYTPRVKHHWKDAIEEVHQITQKEFYIGKKIFHNDLYFCVKNSTEQRILECVDLEEVYTRKETKRKKKDKNFAYYIKMKKIRDRDFRTQIAEGI